MIDADFLFSFLFIVERDSSL